MEAASGQKGFFQPLPKVRNQFLYDPSVRRVFRLFVPGDIAQRVETEITQFADEVLSPQILDWVTDAEKNQPYVAGSSRNAFGQSVSTKLVMAEGWRELSKFSIEKGLVAQGYEEGLHQYTRVVNYLRELIFEGSGANVGCPAAMADGAARVLQHQLRNPESGLSPEQRKVFQNAYDHLTTRDVRRGWTSGQWMTERIGGSDVSLSETIATYTPFLTDEGAPLCDPEEDIPLGPWSIDGFKWFSSATDSNMTILLAQTTKGLSAFYAPMRRHSPSLVSSLSANKNKVAGAGEGTVLNGVTISRLKNKMGTKSLPTAELEVKGMRAWLIGREGEGIKQIATILTITRVRSAVSALGYLSRGLAIARGYSEVREVGAGRGRRMKLTDSPLHMRTLADLTIEHHAMMLLVFYGAYLLGMEEHPPNNPHSSSSAAPRPQRYVAEATPSARHVTPLLRVLTPLLKAYVTKQCIPLIYACMESLGGVGYLENAESEEINVARIFRDACVLNIWEGTTDVLGTDLVRALKHPRGGADSVEALDILIIKKQSAGADDEIDLTLEPVREAWQRLRNRFETDSQDDLVPHAREIMWQLAEILMAVLFALDVKSDDGPVVREMFRRYLESRSNLRLFGAPSTTIPPAKRTMATTSLELNRAIVFGVDPDKTGSSSSTSTPKL
ncbi:very-long-chain acyl-CoA dehydrogenase [Xylariaceae sp. FL0594]|nr:very-long-chain acyl-CoA dehydrogenase [Xylariaceae sp. FL0594]